MLTKQEMSALRSYWEMPIRIRNGNIELKKGNCWGILCSVEDGKMNAKICMDLKSASHPQAGLNQKEPLLSQEN